MATKWRVIIHIIMQNIKITFRKLWQNKEYSFLNIFGLAIGIACASLIFLWVEDESNFNRVNVKKDRIYAVGCNQAFDGKVFTFNGVFSNATPGPLAPALKNEIPGIVNVGRVSHGIASLFTIGEKSIYENGFNIDPSVFDIFTFKFVEGNAKDAFKELYSVVITEKMAKQFFANEKNLLGKTFKVDNDKSYVISGVIKDLPLNTSFQFDWVAPFEITLAKETYLKDNWYANSINTFVELSPSANINSINSLLYGMVQKKGAEKSNTRLFLFGMNDWRLRANFQNGKQSGGLIQYVHLFSIIAWIILAIACINFMNLATARSEKRAKEVGVKKVLGAGKKTLIGQFIGEALFMAALSVIVGIVIVGFVLPLFNELVQKNLELGLDNPLHIAALVVITVVCGVFAGSYPALYLSSFNPVYAFKGMKLKGSGASVVRKGLVVLQFSISIVLIISTVIIYQQIQHIKNRDLGYDRFDLITMKTQGTMISNFAAIKQDLLATGAVENVALNSMNTLYTGDNGPISNLSWQGKNPNINVLISYRSVSPGFISTAGMKMAEGREFVDSKLDSTNILVTESFAKLMGKGSAIGKIITFQNYNMHIVGVVKDFVYGDMYGSPDPVLFACLPQEGKLMYVRMKPNGNTERNLAKIAAVMKRNNPQYPFQYNFLDDQFNLIFTSEMLVGKLSRIFAMLAIIISCLGLFGLSAYTAERRTKEIGIRKVLGASVANVTGLLSREFLQLVFISSLIALPIAWWSMKSWLNNYSYRVSISWWVFAAACVVAMLIALMTISFQSIKAALANPVKSLRSE